MNLSTNDKRPWEEWQLTAFALGELEPALTETISAAANSDAALAAEIEAIRSALAQVTLALKDESQAAPALGSSGELRLQRIIETANQRPVEVQNSLTAQPLPSSRRRNGKSLWLGLLGVAASLLIAAWFSFPAVSDWMLASNQQSPSATSMGDIAATMPSQSEPGPHSLLADIYGQDSVMTFSYEGTPPSGFVLSADGAVADSESFQTSGRSQAFNKRVLGRGG
ncbi:MAG: hypothetical protein ABI557_20535 [Aureliella sp.]